MPAPGRRMSVEMLSEKHRVRTADDDDALCLKDGLDDFLELSGWI